MRIFFIVSLLTLSFQIMAQIQIKSIPDFHFNERVKVERRGYGILLKGKECAFLKNEAYAIGKWSGKEKEAKELQCKCATAQGCSLDIQSIAPEIVKNYQSVCMAKDGPNCWNASLKASGLTDTIRYSTPEEMNFWMESPLCTERKPGEKPSPGDVIAIRSVKDPMIEVHGFTYISPYLSFSKNGYRKVSPYSFQDPHHVYEGYGVPKGCRGIYQKPTEKQKACVHYSNIFKCISFEEYMAKKPSMTQEQKEMMDGLKSSECDLEKITKAGKLIPEDVSDLMFVSLTAIKKLAIEKVDEVSDEDEKLIWKIIAVRADAVRENLGFE